MGLIMQEGKFVSRDEVARVDTPNSTDTWRPVPHIDVIEAVTEVVRAHDWDIEGEKFGLAREGQKMFGVMEISRSSSPEWHRCIGIRNSHDKSFAVGLSAGIVVCDAIHEKMNERFPSRRTSSVPHAPSRTFHLRCSSHAP